MMTVHDLTMDITVKVQGATNALAVTTIILAVDLGGILMINLPAITAIITDFIKTITRPGNPAMDHGMNNAATVPATKAHAWIIAIMAGDTGDIAPHRK